LLEANRGADAVFCAHVGFEDAGTFNDLFRGSLVNRVIGVHFWRVPFAEIPRERDSQTRWLYEQWARVDDWISRQMVLR
jgi:hypothetical protein